MFFKQMVLALPEAHTFIPVLINISRISRIDNDARPNDYVYQDVTLEANTKYTVSVYAAAYSTSYVNSGNSYDRLRFVYRTPGGSITMDPITV